MPARLFLAVAVSASVGFGIHVLYGEGWLNEYIQSAAQAGKLSNILQPPYPMPIVAAAYLTALVPYMAKVGVYHFAGHLLPVRSAFAKGLLFGVVLLAIGDDLVRLPIMNYLVGNPLDVTALMSLESWSIEISSGIIIALLTPLRSPARDA